MNYPNIAAEEFHRLKEYATKRSSELSKMFKDEIEVLVEYETLMCQAAVILGDTFPKDIPDRSIRDLFADTFDFLYISRQLIFEGYNSIAFPLLRRTFETNSLIQYFILLPDKAIKWDKGKQINNVEIRKYLDSHPMGQSKKSAKDMYSFFSRSTHPNREYIPYRSLGEKNKFVLGAIGIPSLFVISDYIQKLIELWFWFAALITYYYRETFCLANKGYGDEYMKVANKAKKIRIELHAIQRRLWEQEYGKDNEVSSNTA